MAVSFEAFFWAIATQESGGRYGAIGPPTPYGRAYGKYQVLAPNVGPWTRKYYGRTLTPQQFLNNPAAQEAVARGKLKEYFNKYGAKGAAAMWYSGQPNPNKTYGNPPVYKYVSSVMGHASKYTGGSGGSTAGYTAADPVRPSLSREELAEQYGLTSALINSSKELKKLFNQAVAGSWSAAKFQAQLKNSKWWKNQSSTLRKYITQRYTDPATWHQSRGAAAAAIRQMAVKVGVPSLSKSVLSSAVYKKLALGWSDTRLQEWLGARVKLQDGAMLGEAGEVFDQLHELAYLNGLKLSTSWYERNARAVVSGKTTIQSHENHIRRVASNMFPAFAQQIQAGQNALDLAAPYIKTVSQLLELAETDVDLFDKHVKAAMKGSEGAAMPLWQFENNVRNDPRWRQTNNAREQMMTVARQVAKDFGLAY